jgi:hypothetical protein
MFKEKEKKTTKVVVYLMKSNGCSSLPLLIGSQVQQERRLSFTLFFFSGFYKKNKKIISHERTRFLTVG